MFCLLGQWVVTRGADLKHFVLRKCKLLNDSNHEMKLIFILQLSLETTQSFGVTCILSHNAIYVSQKFAQMKHQHVIISKRQQDQYVSITVYTQRLILFYITYNMWFQLPHFRPLLVGVIISNHFLYTMTVTV